jgi:AbrB family looped-hinge helix DNA binding protein
MASAPQHVHVQVRAQGRLVIPAALRQRAGIEPGDVLVAHVDQEGRLVMERLEAIHTRIQAMFSHIPPDVSLAEELIAERRAEAAREEAEMEEWIRKGRE